MEKYGADRQTDRQIMTIKYAVCAVHAKPLRQEHRHRNIEFNTNITLNSIRQHNHFITQGNYKATCFDY